jgi:hypothetical protein
MRSFPISHPIKNTKPDEDKLQKIVQKQNYTISGSYKVKPYINNKT